MPTLNLNVKLLLNALLPLVLAIAVVVYVNMEMRQIQESGAEDVQLLLEVEQLNGGLVAAQLALSSYSGYMSGANASDAKEKVAKVGERIASLHSRLKIDEHADALQRIEHKYKELVEMFDKASKASDSTELKRQSIRTLGIVNDSYLLKDKVKSYYDQGLVRTNYVAGITFAVSAGLLLVSCLLSWYTVRRLTKPIRQLNAAALTIAAGDLTVDIIPARSRDEIGQLTESFRKVASSLRTLIDQIVTTSDRLAVSAGEISVRTDEMSQASRQIAETIQEVAVGTENQTYRVKDSEQAIIAMTGSVRNISSHAEKVSGLASEASDKASEGNNTIAATEGQMSAIRQTVQSLESVVARLGERSEHIGAIVSIITGLSLQTKILSLNAGIEAARAGEYGKGFAVVAGEIRKLADDSAESTSRIAELIEAIRSDLALALRSMGDVSREVATGMNAVQTAGGSFAHIREAVEQVVRKMEESTADIMTLVSGSEQVEQSVRVIAGIAEHSAAGTEEVSAATEEQLASVEDMLVAANLLRETAERLREQVHHFKH
ncbi:methyl-accepting chemotaxis protein [Paenibacillus ginsengarvi]|uniref:methyl-accepting chemotaxis protein n=1 Tax=Paenibacillus ginsengarvi TaxID=400777 RepID=UPI001875C4E9|nr:methyl-accepting chemotaxis protein [Paenibacillus ginsengarvi]